ncbi:hypothetical protein Ciccas_007868 [Cichlidogyrus casuarinus]|uniref:PDZ domain-containing protein n=1 Tax=Cichlidogyrus casuarinus TaxID=1844966 RepID=A0ABD2Q1N6_9PLAT
MPYEENLRYCVGIRAEQPGLERIIIAHKDDSIGEIKRQAINLLELRLTEAINFGLWTEGENGRQGKFLQEERPVIDYSSVFTAVDEERIMNHNPEFMLKLEKQVSWLMLKLKARIYDEDIEENRLRKANSKTQQKALIEAVKSNNLKKIMRLLSKGLDPNFQSKELHNGETPLTLAVQQINPRTIVVELFRGGAHLDFRSADSLSPLHKAAICGNYEGLRVLLDLGQNPNCRDWRGLTPLYHGVAIDSPAKCSQCLLFDHAIIGVQDDMGLQAKTIAHEIHQACRFGRTQHLENLLHYGADLNARTKKLNTPLHICVVADQENCLRLLLFRGADAGLINSSGQTPLQCALLTGRDRMAELIETFNPNSVSEWIGFRLLNFLVPVRDGPVYNDSRRATLNGPRGAVTNGSLATSLLSSPQSSLNGIANHFLKPIPKPEVNSDRVILVPKRSTEDLRATLMREEKVSTGVAYRGKMKETTIQPDSKGFGFVLRGARNVLVRENSTTNSRLPTQYMTSIQEDSPAYRCGLRSGDYLLQINGIDVSDASHDQTVRIIRSCLGKPLNIIALSSESPQNSSPRTPRFSKGSKSNEQSGSSDVEVVVQKKRPLRVTIFNERPETVSANR